MVTPPSLWGLIPLVIFIILVFKGWNPIASIVASMIVGAVMGGQSLPAIAKSIQGGMGSFIAYVGLIIMAGGGLGKIAEKTGVARNIVRFVMHRVGVDTPTKAIIGTMIASTLMVAFLGTLAGANAIIAPVVIPIMAAAGISSSVVAVLFQGAGATGLFLGPFTPPMVTLMQLTGLSYPQVLLAAGIPISVLLWITSYIYVQKIRVKSLEQHAYSESDLLAFKDRGGDESPISKQATWAFLATLLGLLIYGIHIKGGATFAIFVIMATALVTGLVGRLHPNTIAETFVDGAKPLVWLFLQFVLFTPFIQYIEDMGAFQALANLMMPLVETGGRPALVSLATVIGVVGVPGAAVAQKVVINQMFASLVQGMAVPMSVWVIVLLVGSQITSFLYPTGDTLGAMGLARSGDLRNMIIFGVVATIPPVLYVILRALLLG
jgi:H+/gluconate symporter-like permease